MDGDRPAATTLRVRARIAEGDIDERQGLCRRRAVSEAKAGGLAVTQASETGQGVKHAAIHRDAVVRDESLELGARKNRQRSKLGILWLLRSELPFGENARGSLE